MNFCRELKESGQKYGVCGTLCHIVRTKLTGPSSFLPGSQHQYTMRVASVGEARAVLCRHSELIDLSQTTQTVSKFASMPSCYIWYIRFVHIKPVYFVTVFFFFFPEPKS